MRFLPACLLRAGKQQAGLRLSLVGGTACPASAGTKQSRSGLCFLSLSFRLLLAMIPQKRDRLCLRLKFSGCLLPSVAVLWFVVVPFPFYGTGCASSIRTVALLHKKIPYLNMFNSFIGVSRKFIHCNYLFCIIISDLQ